MVSDQEIAESLGTLFRETNPNTFTTLNDVVVHLQSKLGFDLSHKLDFIRSQISIIFSTSHPPQQQQQPPPPQPAHPAPPPANPIFRTGPSVHYHPHQPQGPVFRGTATEINFAQPGHHQAALAATSHAAGPDAPPPKERSVGFSNF